MPQAAGPVIRNRPRVGLADLQYLFFLYRRFDFVGPASGVPDFFSFPRYHWNMRAARTGRAATQKPGPPTQGPVFLRLPTTRQGLRHWIACIRLRHRPRRRCALRHCRRAQRRHMPRRRSGSYFLSVRNLPSGPPTFFWRRVLPSRPPSTAHSAKRVGAGSNSRGSQSLSRWSSSA